MIECVHEMQAQLARQYPNGTPAIKRFVIDSCDVNPQRFARPFYNELPQTEILSQHRADADFVRFERAVWVIRSILTGGGG